MYISLDLNSSFAPFGMPGTQFFDGPRLRCVYPSAFFEKIESRTRRVGKGASGAALFPQSRCAPLPTMRPGTMRHGMGTDRKRSQACAGCVSLSAVGKGAAAIVWWRAKRTRLCPPYEFGCVALLPTRSQFNAVAR